MKSIISGVVVGIIISIGIFLPIFLYERQSQYDYGSKNGKIQALFEVADVIDKEFGRYDGIGKYKRLFSVKSTDVIIVEINGVKTVRLIP